MDLIARLRLWILQDPAGKEEFQGYRFLYAETFSAFQSSQQLQMTLSKAEEVAFSQLPNGLRNVRLVDGFFSREV